MERSRHFIGKGKEHIVVSSKKDGWVLKRPNNWYAFTSGIYSQFKGQPTAQTIRDDFYEASQKIDGIHIRLPKTRVVAFGQDGYVMAQHMIDEDYSIAIPTLFAKQYGNEFIAKCYESNSENFISNNGSLYWIDPNKGPLCRTLTGLKILSWEQYMSAKVFAKKTWRNIDYLLSNM